MLLRSLPVIVFLLLKLEKIIEMHVYTLCPDQTKIVFRVHNDNDTNVGVSDTKAT